jgi:hypothetical protein
MYLLPCGEEVLSNTKENTLQDGHKPGPLYFFTYASKISCSAAR